MRKLHFIIFVLLFLSGCSTLDKDQCAAGHWEEIGFVDGQKGRTSSYFENHRRTCKGILTPSDSEAYERGRLQGFRQYCTEEGGYVAGLTYGLPPAACDFESQALFNKGFEKGRKVSLLESERGIVRDQLQKERKRIEEDKSVVNHVAQTWHLLSGTSPTADLENRESYLGVEIASAKAGAPMGMMRFQQEELQRRTSMSLIGAMVGTGVGFGSGHAIQGRYSESGWKWTVADTLAFGAVIATTANCESRSGPRGPTRVCEGAAPMLSILALLGLRVWQGIDLWGHTYRTYQGYPMAGDPPSSSKWSFAPRFDQPGMQVGYLF